MKTYVGTAAGTSDSHTVEIHQDGELTGLLHHHVKHSPSGFSWGYAGSGPADLARCLLIDHLGPGAWCPACRATGYQVWDETAQGFAPFNPDTTYPPQIAETKGGCVECFGELTSFGPSTYQAFKRDVVARFPQEGRWALTGSDIDRWFEAEGFAR